MQGGANYDFTPEEIATLRRYFLKGGFLWEDDNWTDADWENAYFSGDEAPGAPNGRATHGRL